MVSQDAKRWKVEKKKRLRKEEKRLLGRGGIGSIYVKSGEVYPSFRDEWVQM